MQDKDIQALKALAEKATGWNWETVQGDQFGHMNEDGVFYDIGTVDADQYAVGEEAHNEVVLNFIAATTPAAILSLIASHEQQAARIAELEVLKSPPGNFAERYIELSAENRSLKACIAELEAQRPAVDLGGLTRYGFCDFDADNLIERPDGEFVKLSDARALLDAGDTCATCSGRGDVGGFEGGAAPGFVSYPCPDCSTSTVREESNTEWAARHLMPFKGRDTSAVRGVGLTDEQIMRIAGDVRQRNAGSWPGDVAFARAIERELLSTANAAQAGVREQALEEAARVVMDGNYWNGAPAEVYETAADRAAAIRALKSTPSPSVNSKEGGNG